MTSQTTGQRFLLLQPTENELAPVTHPNVVLNWLEDVKQKSRSAAVQS